MVRHEHRTRDEVATVLHMARQCASVRDIAHTLDRSENTIYRTLKEYGVRTNPSERDLDALGQAIALAENPALEVPRPGREPDGGDEGQGQSDILANGPQVIGIDELADVECSITILDGLGDALATLDVIRAGLADQIGYLADMDRRLFAAVELLEDSYTAPGSGTQI